MLRIENGIDTGPTENSCEALRQSDGGIYKGVMRCGRLLKENEDLSDIENSPNIDLQKQEIILLKIKEELREILTIISK